MVRAVVLARYPVPGRCKTRLIPKTGPEGAALVHKRLAERTVETLAASGLEFEVWGTGAEPEAFASWLGPVAIKSQPEGDLGAKLLAAGPPYPTLFFGTDCPDLSTEHLESAAESLRHGQAVIGPAHDGGYWTIGLPEPAPSLFQDMPWGTDEVYQRTRTKMMALGIEPFILPTLHDLDRPEDLARWPKLWP